VAYRTDISKGDRGGAIAAVIAIHAALLFAVLHHWGGGLVEAGSPVLQIFDVPNRPPPPPPPPPPRQRQKAEPKEKEGGSAPPNIKSEATPVKAPIPKIAVPPLPQIAASETPRQGTSPTQGAAPVVGPGTGAGGIGNGTGSGAGGNGPGGGGAGGVVEPPHLTSPVLTGRDFPRELLNQWPRGSSIFMRLRVDARGYVSECTVDRGTGIAAIDSSVCNLAHERLRFRPALNRRGQAVAGWFGYAQRAPQ
jgi:periplasmic protein TonB